MAKITLVGFRAALAITLSKQVEFKGRGFPTNQDTGRPFTATQVAVRAVKGYMDAIDSELSFNDKGCNLPNLFSLKIKQSSSETNKKYISKKVSTNLLKAIAEGTPGDSSPIVPSFISNSIQEELHFGPKLSRLIAKCIHEIITENLTKGVDVVFTNLLSISLKNVPTRTRVVKHFDSGLSRIITTPAHTGIRIKLAKKLKEICNN